MARRLRFEFPGGLYHVTARGDGEEDICLSHDNRRLNLEVLGGTVQRFHWTNHACGLMSMHYHLLVETPEGISPRVSKIVRRDESARQRARRKT